jgi:XTP/dITP diphosphohydrolase
METHSRQFSQLVLASSNAGKLREFSELLSPLGCKVLTQSSLGIAAAEEPFHTFLENALAKARHASQFSQLPALADDSGICVPSLGGMPGIYSARYAQRMAVAKNVVQSNVIQSDAANNECLQTALAQTALGNAPLDRRAYYYCVLVLVRHAEDPQPIVADGIWHGIVAQQPKGQNGFGYDPWFVMPDSGLSAAELSREQKNKISHRALAIRDLMIKMRGTGLI